MKPGDKLEGVPYYPFLIRFSTEDGKRRTSVLWAPGFPRVADNPWIGEIVNRYLNIRGDVDVSKRVLVQQRPERKRK